MSRHEDAVLFWCSDLKLRGPVLGTFRVVTPSGRIIAEGRTKDGAWIKTLAVIREHLEHSR